MERVGRTAAVERFLEGRVERAMFPLSNLRAHGPWEESDHPYATAIWVDDPDAPTAVLGLTRSGMAMPVMDAAVAPGSAAILAGRPLMGFAGEAAPVRALMDACGLRGAAAQLDSDEPHFLLDLDALTMPNGDGVLVPLTKASDTARAWRAAYDLELHVVAAAEAEERAADDVARYIAEDTHRLMVVDGEPVALTGFNARLADIVQVGGVYVPPPLRNRGYGRRVVALHLAEARAAGVERATLFAANDAAARAYAGLGFRRIGDYALVLFDGRPVAEAA